MSRKIGRPERVADDLVLGDLAQDVHDLGGQRLSEQLPERYADVTGPALSSTLTGLKLGIESKSGKELGGGDARPKGVYRAALQRAIERRSGE